MVSITGTPAPPVDLFARPMGDLRLSVIDQCNLRCQYCMPEEHYTWLPKADAPIWKKEHSRDGAEWVGMGP